MPLPDERPPPSVAKLIARLEGQQKRTGTANEPPKPIQLPGRIVSGLQERKTSLGPDLAANLAKSPPSISRTTSESSPKITAVPIADVSAPSETSEPAPKPLSALAEPTEVSTPETVALPETPVVIPEISAPSNDAAPQLITTEATIALAKKPSVKKPAAPSSNSSTRTPVRISKARSPPPVSAAKASSINKSTTSTQPIRPQQTGNASLRGAVSPTPHYMTPIRPQNTGTQTDANLRAKTPVTKPRTSNGTSALMKPTASSLAKARPPVAAAVKSTTNAPVKKAPASTLDPTQPSVRARTTSSTVPFPSARKPKAAAPPSSTKSKTTESSTALAPGAPGSRTARISQSSSKGPSAAALAARARVNAPPVPTVPATSTPSKTKSSGKPQSVPSSNSTGPPATIQVNPTLVPPVTISKDDAPPVAFPTADSAETMAEADTSVTTVVEPLEDGSGNVLVADDVDGIAVTSPSAPLTHDALEAHDKVESPQKDQLSGEGAGVDAGDVSVMAVRGDVDDPSNHHDATTLQSTNPTPVVDTDGPSTQPIHDISHPPHHQSSTILPPPSSPTLERDGTDHVLGPVPSGHDVKDDADFDAAGYGDNDIPDEDA